MSKTEETVYLGIHGFVIALDRSTGKELWRVRLIGSDFVNVVLDRDQLLVTTKGEVFCLDAGTGEVRWQNKLTGLGLGLVTIVTAAAPAASIGPAAEMKERQQAHDAAG